MIIHVSVYLPHQSFDRIMTHKHVTHLTNKQNPNLIEVLFCTIEDRGLVGQIGHESCVNQSLLSSKLRERPACNS